MINEKYDGKKLGFGLMRLPMKSNTEVDIDEVIKMADLFMKEGFNYFDTAHGYLDGLSEKAFKVAVADRYDRESYILTNKLTGDYWREESDIEPLFESQLAACGVSYFDNYLMHAQNARLHERYLKNGAYKVCKKLKEEGKIKHLGISFHDTSDVLEKILTDCPEIELVQIQFNYYDYDNDTIQSKKCLDVCIKHNKDVLIMEPVKGGGLVNLLDDAKKVLNDLGDNNSVASYAIRFAASQDNVYKVLSGMSSLEQMQDNLSYMKDFKKITDKENEAISMVREILKNRDKIECTNCRYCVAGCPKKILIPDIFKSYNEYMEFNYWASNYIYENAIKENGKPSDCIKCGKCEMTCPQKLPVRSYLGKINEEYSKK